MIDNAQMTRLPNGLTVLTEHMPELRSVSLGILVAARARDTRPAPRTASATSSNMRYSRALLAVRPTISRLNQIVSGASSTLTLPTK